MMNSLEEAAALMYASLKAMPCRCQMKGGAKWHFRAQPEVEKQCSRCAAIDAYDKVNRG